VGDFEDPVRPFLGVVNNMLASTVAFISEAGNIKARLRAVPTYQP
jgi:hypothetical protein